MLHLVTNTQYQAEEEADDILEEQDTDDDGVVTKEEILAWLRTREDQEVEEIFK